MRKAHGIGCRVGRLRIVDFGLKNQKGKKSLIVLLVEIVGARHTVVAGMLEG